MKIVKTEALSAEKLKKHLKSFKNVENFSSFQNVFLEISGRGIGISAKQHYTSCCTQNVYVSLFWFGRLKNGLWQTNLDSSPSHIYF